ncbi:ABC transporter permease, branched-chain amino acid transport system [Rhodoferax antarcticus ANT.BR]|uniref:ABC transporter permease, branched-chain amino acid transport system n=1 Tax=Rhodoferax antarcticus ANT.BR TaxID=1111071 RepID=A0A1Q8YET0_9BURK|nr:ABC transporter permease, branched-chain amino acid transport system [Rhodoferax antarcticus ANT.BR]
MGAEVNRPSDLAVTQHPNKLPQALVWGAYALLLALAPLLLTSSLNQSLLSQMGIAIIVCLSYNLLLGQGGMVSFGHAVYSGLGAFLAIHTLNRVTDGWPLPVSLIPLVGGLGSAALALALGWVTTRRAGTAFAMITFGMGELLWATALVLPGFFGGEGGVSGNRVAGSAPLGLTFGPQIQLYYLIALYTLVCTALMYALTRTPLGRLLNAVRDNPQRVAFVGYNPQKVRYMVFVMAAFFAGIAGGLSALHYEIVTAEVFSAQRSGAYLLFTFIGGTTFFFGPVLGAVLMVLGLGLLPGLTPAWLLYLGVVFVATVMVAPGGLAGLLVALWRQAGQGAWRRLWPTQLALAASTLIAVGPLYIWVEMTFRLQQADVLAPTLLLLGVTLDARSPVSWAGCGVVSLLGAGLWLASRRALAQKVAS